MVKEFLHAATDEIENNTLINFLLRISEGIETKINIDEINGFKGAQRLRGTIVVDNMRGTQLNINFSQHRYLKQYLDDKNHQILVDNLKLSIDGQDMTEQEVVEKIFSL